MNLHTVLLITICNVEISVMLSFMGSVILVFLGFLGEYIAAINTRMMHRPLVIEEERINFE